MVLQRGIVTLSFFVIKRHCQIYTMCMVFLGRHTYVTLKVLCENILMISLCELAATIISLSPSLERIVLFMLVLRDRSGSGICTVYN